VQRVLAEFDDRHIQKMSPCWYHGDDQLTRKKPDQFATVLVRVDGRSATPLHQQIYEGLRARILAGALPPAARLPSSRQLARDLGVARTTVLQAFAALTAEGYLVARRASSTQVAPELPADLALQPAHAPPATSRRPRLSASAKVLAAFERSAPRLGLGARAFRPGAPALDLFPTTLWARIASRRLARASVALLESADAAGHLPLREAIAAHVGASRGVRATAEQVFIVSGTTHALDEILMLAVDPRDEVWVEDPGYFGSRRTVLAARARMVAVPVDGEGMDVAVGLSRARRAKAALVTPSHHYPLGVTMSLPRRLALLRWAAAARAWVIEDDYDSEFRHRGRPLMALQGLDEAGVVVYVGTFSKSIFPGLRLGFLVAPPALVDVFLRARLADTAPASALDQATLADFIADGHFARHLRRMRNTYRERAEALRAALTAECGGALALHDCDTGMQLVADLLVARDRDVRDEAGARGIEVAALSDYFLDKAPESGLVFGFGGVRPEGMRDAAQKLHLAIEAARKRRQKKSIRS
jgi:GntR family transcriptional regulator/MocR family aminotransferase